MPKNKLLKLPALILMVLSISILFPHRKVLAQATISKQLHGKIIKMSEQENVQTITVQLPSKQEITITIDKATNPKEWNFKIGNKVVLQQFGDPETPEYVITDFYRANTVVGIFVVFILATILVGRKYGILSLVGMYLTFMAIFKILLPALLAGKSPVVTTLAVTMGLVPVTFYLSHGINKKTHVAIISTLITLLGTVILTALTLRWAHITGYATDEAMFLKIARENTDMAGILLAGIIIGFLGILDDVTISQASVVTQLKHANPNLDAVALYKKGMEVGRDHIASMVNTLILVYAGASMPLLLMFLDKSKTFMELINLEMVADEVLRMLLGSIGLIVAVPLATFITAIVAEEDTT